MGNGCLTNRLNAVLWLTRSFWVELGTVCQVLTCLNHSNLTMSDMSSTNIAIFIPARSTLSVRLLSGAFGKLTACEVEKHQF